VAVAVAVVVLLVMIVVVVAAALINISFFIGMPTLPLPLPLPLLLLLLLLMGNISSLLFKRTKGPFITSTNDTSIATNKQTPSLVMKLLGPRDGVVVVVVVAISFHCWVVVVVFFSFRMVADSAGISSASPFAISCRFRRSAIVVWWHVSF
jgi:hypothetical protein